MRNLPSREFGDWLTKWGEFDRPFGRWMQDMWPWQNFQKEVKEWGSFSPACDVQETNELYIFSFDVPGLKESDIKVEVHDNRLYVTGERRDEFKEETATRRMVECQYGRFERMFTLPKVVNEEGVEAVYADGVLKVVVPKSREAKKRSIEVKKGTPSH